MTATYQNAVFTKDGVTVTVQTSDYSENYNKANLKKVPSVVTSQTRITNPDNPNYGIENKSTIIDLGLNPERRLTINGYIINETSFTDTHGPAIDKKNDLIRMFMTGGNVTLTLETGGVYTFFTNVIVDKFEFKKLSNDAVGASGVSSLPTDVAEYSCVISMEDATEYAT